MYTKRQVQNANTDKNACEESVPKGERGEGKRVRGERVIGGERGERGMRRREEGKLKGIVRQKRCGMVGGEREERWKGGGRERERETIRHKIK